MTGVYNPKTFILHAASLRQGCPHCEKFSTAATRRCLDRLSVPVWLVVLSDQLPVKALVGLYPANQLIGRDPLPKRPCGLWPFTKATCGINPPFGGLSPTLGQVQVVTCYAPVRHSSPRVVLLPPLDPVRLACLIHAASVRSEPESNSPLKGFNPPLRELGDPDRFSR